MANPVSDMKWNEIVTKFGTYTGGAMWYSHYVNSSAHTSFVDATWKHFDLSDFDETQHETTTGNPSATPYELVLETFANNVKLVALLSYYVGGGGVANNVNGVLRLKKPNGTYVALSGGTAGTLNGFDSGPPASTCTPALLRTYGINVAFITNYMGTPTASAGGVMEGVTPADMVCFVVLMPFMRGDVVQSWTHVHNGTMCMSDKDNPDFAYLPPNGFMDPDIVTNRQFICKVCQYTDLDTMVAAIQAANPDIPIDKDALIKKGVKDDPSQEQDPSQPGGGGGNYDDTSDPIDFPSLPTGGAIATGSIKSFLVDTARVQALFRRLWNSSLFDIVTWQKIIEEPLDALVSLICIPCTPTSGDGAHIQLGNIDTEVVAPVITSQYVTVDCGSLTIPEYWGSALDYSPYTKIDIYLPFIGIRPVKAEDFVNQTISIKYNMDILTGNLTAQIKCGQSVLYKFQGNAKATVPITSRIFDALESLMKGAGSVAAAYATGAMKDNAAKEADPEVSSHAALQSAGAAAINSAVNVAMSKVQLTRSGDLSGSTGLLDDFTPYVIIHRPQQSLANNFKAYKGYPSNISAVLNTLTGYTEVEYIHLTGIDGATDAELNEIEALLKAGVII